MSKRVRERRIAPSTGHIQYAALPYRGTEKSELEIMLVTSRETRRWIIPKGWPKGGMPPHDAAAEEAFEEAGVAGKVSKRPIGSYSYDKILQKGDITRCSVQVFALRVTCQHKRWPEKQERQIVWYTAAQAARRVREPHLRRIIRTFAKHRKTVR
jgi:8-oxo-dGTP pyrophosphatase MutT (NUDIX family)